MLIVIKVLVNNLKSGIFLKVFKNFACENLIFQAESCSLLSTHPLG